MNSAPGPRPPSLQGSPGWGRPGHPRLPLGRGRSRGAERDRPGSESHRTSMGEERPKAGSPGRRCGLGLLPFIPFAALIGGLPPPRSTVREVKGREVCGPSEERRAKGRDRRGWEASQAPDFTPEAPDGWQGCHHSPPLPGLQRAAWQYFLSLGETQCRGQRSRCSHKIQPSCPLCLNRTVKKATHSTPGPTVLKSTHF